MMELQPAGCKVFYREKKKKKRLALRLIGMDEIINVSVSIIAFSHSLEMKNKH